MWLEGGCLTETVQSRAKFVCHPGVCVGSFRWGCAPKEQAEENFFFAFLLMGEFNRSYSNVDLTEQMVLGH